MFSFDQAALPQVTAGKALILVDFQNDFLSKDGALPVAEADSVIDRTIALVEAYRSKGAVVWVETEFKELRPVNDDKILVTDALLRNPRKPRPPVDPTEVDQEAFLSVATPNCVQTGTDGIKVPEKIQKIISDKDLRVSKSHYSSFQDSTLLRLLRSKMVMDVTLCGSLLNVGVYATALDAAGHGMKISIIEDCCGYRNESRQLRALRNLVDLLGCEFMTSAEFIESLQPVPPKKSTKTSRSSPKPASATPDDLVGGMSNLQLRSASLAPQPPLVPDEANSKAPSSAQLDATNIIEPDGKESILDKLKPEVTTKTTTNTEIPAASKDRQTSNPKIAISSKVDTPTTAKMEPDQDSKQQPQPESEFLMRGICAGDTDVIPNLLPEHIENSVFDKLRDEVAWQRMSHQGGEVPRLVAVQGEVAEDGSIPVYRHPSDESPPLLPFSPTVLAIKAETEKHLGHPLNHVLIQFYRDGNDYISEHSDKTLDIVQGSYIANVSIGAQRTMVLRTKRLDKDPSNAEPTSDTKRQIQRAELPHNSLCKMGLQTNMKWLHAIRQDKRAERDKSASELAYKGARISLTFRNIGTFLNREETLIWGQGAPGKTKEEAQEVVNGTGPEAIKLLRAFGTENHSSNFDWNAHYGDGFNVLHIRSSPRLFASTDKYVNMPIALMLAEYDIGYAKGVIASTKESEDGDGQTFGSSLPIKYVDNDADKSEVQGDVAIMLYLYSRSQANKEDLNPSNSALDFTRFQRAQAATASWRRQHKLSEDKDAILKVLKKDLEGWNTCASASPFMAGDAPGLTDFSFWPALHRLVEEHGHDILANLDDLKKYFDSMKERASTRKVLDSLRESSDSKA
mgnify:CR=1 FL=1